MQACMALAVSLAAASFATAEPLPWDQEKVTEIAAELPTRGRGARRDLPIYRRMITTVRDAARELNRIPAQKPVEEHFETVAGVLKRIRPFYEKDPVI
jgi:hypothetical protein